MSNAHMFKRLETIEHNYLLSITIYRNMTENLKRCCRAFDDMIPEPIEGFFEVRYRRIFTHFDFHQEGNKKNRADWTTMWMTEY